MCSGSAVLDPHELMPLGNRRNPSYVRTHECWVYTWTCSIMEAAGSRIYLSTAEVYIQCFCESTGGGGRGQNNCKAWLFHSAAMT